MIAQVDFWVLEQMHELAAAGGELMNGIMSFISILADKGLIVLLLAVILMIRPSTRKLGVCIFGAVALGTVLGNGVLKFFIHRSRPFASGNAQIYQWWIDAGAHMKYSSSFPSGHVMVVAAAMMVLYLTYRKKIYIAGLFFASAVMACSRCYLMAHYFSDTVGGLLLGIFSGCVAYLITEKRYGYWEEKQFFIPYRLVRGKEK